MSVEPSTVNRLREHEAAIERSLSELGWHLRAIRDGRLYRETHETFELYCRERWSYGRRYVNQQIAAAEMIDALPLGANAPIPREGTVRPLSLLPAAERAEAWTEAVERSAGEPTARDVAEVVAERRTPQAVPKPTVADGVPPHPATYPAAVITAFDALIDEYAGECAAIRPLVIVDPFAGVGGIHKLSGWGTTVGVEIESEWAAAHPSTICGDSRRLVQLLGDGTADVIATSPAYGNRLADSYNASDPEARRSYPIDLGRKLTEGSGAGLHFTAKPDDEYKQLHAEVWAACARVLKPDGLLLLNCKDFVAGGVVMSVTAWHLHELRRLGFDVVDLFVLPVGGLAMTTAARISEVVVAFARGRS